MVVFQFIITGIKVYLLLFLSIFIGFTSPEYCKILPVSQGSFEISQVPFCCNQLNRLFNSIQFNSIQNVFIAINLLIHFYIITYIIIVLVVSQVYDKEG